MTGTFIPERIDIRSHVSKKVIARRAYPRKGQKKSPSPPHLPVEAEKKRVGEKTFFRRKIILI
jgi:hypothetical protein